MSNMKRQAESDLTALLGSKGKIVNKSLPHWILKTIGLFEKYATEIF
jgi:hypothetical protein